MGGDTSEAPLDTSSTFTPESPPDTCRDCRGLRYYRPSATPSGATAPSKTPSDAESSADLNVEFDRSHLSSDRRVKTARALIQRNRFAEALGILKPLALGDRPDQTDVRFLLGLAASRGSQAPEVKDDERVKLLNLANRGLPGGPDQTA